jgi:hypothetical protein
MSDIQPNELFPGFVMHLSGEELAKQAGVKSNAEPGREVKGEHYFLLLEKACEDSWLVVPLFSSDDKDRIRLEPKLKTGKGKSWKEKHSFVHPEQHWIVSEDALLAALSNDDSVRGSRRYYAQKHTDKLSALSELKNRNPREFRELGTNQ